MLQRIQTVYLLLVGALFIALLFMPLAIITADQIYRFDVTGLNTVMPEAQLIFPTWGLFALTAIIALLAVVTIFLYKKRVLQIRLTIFNTLLMVGFYALVFYYVYNVKADMEGTALNVKFALSFPLIAIILNYLAIRNIGADEALVRSLNRLR
ncbi:DUF4293 domain-containing protein [Parabacteroides sp. OttesenSCG-928-G06]|nr:DUF4293 domain-containing protein [Parabacteroides sp. OttesenSCG-928-K15]MDL2281831.1 DUF4293 domain-containing protein [Parabacteroides sp. OttesenSCG-928-G06]